MAAACTFITRRNFGGPHESPRNPSEKEEAAMTKTYCDGCGKEITAANECCGGHVVESRLGTEMKKNGKRLRLELMHSTNDKWNDGHWCKYCIIDAFSKLDDRQRKK